MNSFVPLSVPNLKGKELEYITDAVASEWVAAGPYIERFENALAGYIGAKEVVAVQSGTAGLHLAYLEAGITREDMVIAPCLTFIATLNPVGYIGAEPIFMDCDDSLCIDVKKLRSFCEEECELRNDVLYHKGKNKQIKAVIVVHIFGNLADMGEIRKIADKYHLMVIEDATEALGSYYISGEYNGSYAGTLGDISVLSFNGNKVITASSGGAIIAKNPTQLKHMRYLSQQSKDDELRFIHNEIGFNYRMTNMQAALGLAQLEQLDSFIAIKKRNYKIYLEEGLELLPFKDDVSPNYWFYSIMTDGKKDLLIEDLAKKNIQSRPIWELMHRLRPFKDSLTYMISKAPYYHSEVVNIPCSTNLDEETVRYVAKEVKSILSRN